jgi:hypothetical protein
MSTEPKKYLTALQMRTTAFKSDSAAVLLLAERLQQANILLEEWARFSKGLKFDENPDPDAPAVPAPPQTAAGTDRG